MMPHYELRRGTKRVSPRRTKGILLHHERTKQRIAHLNVLAMVSAAKAQPVTPQGSPRGRGMTRWAERFFVQQQLQEMNLD